MTKKREKKIISTTYLKESTVIKLGVYVAKKRLTKTEAMERALELLFAQA